jgi:hypothetical protein
LRSRSSLFLVPSRKGIALVSVMLVSIILLALAGAFFAAHRTDLMLMGTSTKLEKTKNAALSAAEFFQYKLQNDRFFGAVPFKNGKTEDYPIGAGDPMMTIEYVSEGDNPNKNVVIGRIHKTGLTFEGRLLNNLGKDAVAGHPLGTTPPRSVRVWITTKQGFIVKNMDFILKRSPFSSVSMLSGNDIQVDLANSEDGHWWLGARQASGNAVRANGEIRGPEVLSETGRAVLFEPPDGMADKVQPPYGVIQGKDLKMQMNGVMTDIQSDDDRLQDVEDNILGVLSPDGAGVEVPNLDADELTSPSNSFKIPANDVAFRTRDGDNGRVVHELLEDGKVVATYGDRNRSSRHHIWSKGSKVAAVFDLESRTMTVTDNYELHTEGSFTLRGTTGDGDSDAGDGEPDRGKWRGRRDSDWGRRDEGNQPTLVLGSQRGGASIDANGITVKGSVGGKGALKAGDRDLSIRAKSSLSTTPDFGVALHSNDDIYLSKPGSSSADGIPPDWDAFSKAFQNQPNEKLDHWSELEPKDKSALTAEFADVILSEPGTYAGDDPIWLSLTGEFAADERAMEAYESWTQEHADPVEGPDPDWDPMEPPLVPVMDENGEPVFDSEGDVVMEPEPIWPPEPPLIPVVDSEGKPRKNWKGKPIMRPDPDWEWDPQPPIIEIEAGQDQGTGLNVENYVRMREYLKTLDRGKPDETWLDAEDPTVQASRHRDVQRLIKNQLSSYQLLAGQTAVEKDGYVRLKWNKLSQYFSGSNPFLTGYSADMSFRGLIYAGDDFRFDTQQQGIEIEGALVAKGDIDIINATGARIIYNAELLENMFVANEGDTSAKLERAYWAYY